LYLNLVPISEAGKGMSPEAHFMLKKRAKDTKAHQKHKHTHTDTKASLKGVPAQIWTSKRSYHK
jgi:hypothetical protein